jgi:hypothetical protein
MLRQMVKIANKLDSLGLTKEADVLDRYINKMAQESGGMSQDTDYDRMMQDERLKDAERRAQTYQYEQQEMKLAESISEDVILYTPDNLKASAATFKDSFMKAWITSPYTRTSFYNPATWKDAGEKMANKMWDKYGQSDAGTAEDPWAQSYGSRAKELKSVWTKRTTATKKNPSFDNFQAWLRSRRLVGVSVDTIIQKLIMETSNATTAAVPSTAVQTFVSPGGGLMTPDEPAGPAFKPGFTDRTDARLPTP